MPRTMKEFLTVKEFSALSGIEQTTLRYWDEIGLFSPVMRNPDNNYRRYSPNQIISANFITTLSKLNIPLKVIAQAKRERTPRSTVMLMEQQEKYLDMEMKRLRESYSIIHTRLGLIRRGLRLEEQYAPPEALRADDCVPKVEVVRHEENVYILGMPNEYRPGESHIEPFSRFCQSAEELRINISYPIGGYHKDIKGFLRAPDRPENFFSLDPTGNRKQAEGMYLTGYCRCDYGEVGDLPQQLMAYAEENKLDLSGPVYTIYLYNEISERNPSKYLMQVYVAVSNKNVRQKNRGLHK